jgi:hypothetical protein
VKDHKLAMCALNPEVPKNASKQSSPTALPSEVTPQATEPAPTSIALEHLFTLFAQALFSAPRAETARPARPQPDEPAVKTELRTVVTDLRQPLCGEQISV